jgi:DNA-binding MarR family transcriptional regulator
MSSRLPDTSARRAPENLAILLREPFRAMTDELMARLAAGGHPEVRSAHAAVFEYLDDAGTRVSVLAERAGMTKQSMTELVAHLERHGYVERVPDPADGRARLVRATVRGREVFAVARDAMRDVQARLDARVGPERMATLRGLLEEVGRELGAGGQ